VKHIDDVHAFVDLLLPSENFHSLILEGAPGWGKSSAVESIMKKKNIPFVALGSYSTPLKLFNFLSKNSTGIVVIDDCAGLFGDSTAMSVLKAATWPSSGTEGTRLVSWGSTSEKLDTEAFFFEGKIILLTNHVPKKGDGAAFVSRSLHYCIAPGPAEMEELIHSVAASSSFSDSALALEVAKLLIERGREADFRGINLRTLRLGYELAKSNTTRWRELFDRLLPSPDPTKTAYLAIMEKGTVEEQFREFHRATGLSRRTFFYYRTRQKVL
jgi:hypothetical protein